MDSEEAPRCLEDGVYRLDPMPARSEGIQTFEGSEGRIQGKEALPFAPGDGRDALDSSSPPGDRSGFAEVEIPEGNRILLFDQQRHQGRAVPELHRPSLRSARRASRTLPPSDGRGACAIRISRGEREFEARRKSPWRSRRATRPSGSSPSPSADSKRATGRPRSRMRIVSPCWT